MQLTGRLVLIQKLLFISVSGMAGTLARYGLAGAVQRASGGVFPWGTATVNICGCFLAGILWTLAESRISLSSELRAAVFVGFMGAFTTFSTFILETSEMLRDGDWLRASGNLALQISAGLVVFFAGVALARLV